jgi:capsular exopolysaccharide synthesis family protein
LVEAIVRSVETEAGDGLTSGSLEQDGIEATFEAAVAGTEFVGNSEGTPDQGVLANALLDSMEREVDYGKDPIQISAEPAPFEEPLHPAYERIIQTLLAFRRTPRQSVVLFASAVSGEGTSTVARNTAIALGRHRTERTLLVDANLRTPSQHLAFKIDRNSGLSNVMKGTASLTSAIRNDVRPGLSFLPAGAPADSPPHLLTQSALQGVVMALTSLFDWVIVDGPPATPYPDVAGIAGASGGAVMVCRAEKTRWEVAEEAKRVLEQSGVDVLGAVLNRREYHIPNFLYRRL